MDRGAISSLVVEALPERVESVADALRRIEGVEVHGIDSYKIVITIEAETVDESHEIASGMIGIEGVIGVNLVYMNFEDDRTIYPDGV